MKFKFKDKDRPQNICTYLAYQMQIYPENEILIADYLMEKCNKDEISSILACLNKENMFIVLSSKSLDNCTNKTEHYYKTKYSNEPISEEILQKFDNPQIQTKISKKILDFPPKNIFIPKDINVLDIQNEENYPKNILQTKRSDLWFKQDNNFKICKASFVLNIYSNELNFIKINKNFSLFKNKIVLALM